MTLAVVVATGTVGPEPSPSAGLRYADGTVVARLLAQLASLGVPKPTILTRPESASALRALGLDVVESKCLADDLREIGKVARDAHEPVLILHGDVVAHQEVLARLVLTGKAPASAVLARSRFEGPPSRPVARVRGGRVVSAGTRYHQVTDPNAVFRGVLWVSAEQTRTLADVAGRLATLTDTLTETTPIRHLRGELEPTGNAGLDASSDQPYGAGLHLTHHDSRDDLESTRRDLPTLTDLEATHLDSSKKTRSGLPTGADPEATHLDSSKKTRGDLPTGTDLEATHLDSSTKTRGDLPVMKPRGELPLAHADDQHGDDAPALVLCGLVRAGVRVTGHGDARLVCDRALDAPAVATMRQAIEAVDEDRVRLDEAVKNNDGFFTTFAVSTYSRFIARWCAERGLTPNMVTSISMAVSVVAAVFFALGHRWGMVLGGISFYFAFVLDCVDGQLARYTRQFSTLGAWLDATFDRAKEYVVFAGLAVGSSAAALGSAVHAGDVWYLAVGALILQTGRHMIDFAYGVTKRRVPREPIPVLSLADASDAALDPPTGRLAARRRGGIGQMVVGLSNATERVRVLHWAKKIVVLPIGERFALIAVTAMLFDARVTFWALLIWGGLAAAYTLLGRLMRSLALPRQVVR